MKNIKWFFSFLIISAFIQNTSVFASQNSLFCKLADPDSFYYQKYCLMPQGYYTSSSSTTLAPTGKASDIVMQYLIIPTEKSAAYKKLSNLKNSVGPVFRYENVDFDQNNSNEGADIYGTTLMWAKDTDSWSYGIFVPYDYMIFNDSLIDDVNQIGAIGFGQYRIPFSEDKYLITLTANLNYFFANLDFKNNDSDDVNSVGTGIGVGLKMLAFGNFIPTIGLSYQYQNDDTDTEDHHLFRTGLNLAYLAGEKWAINGFAIWSADLTDYDTGDNDNYWDLGIEISFQATDTWNLNLGYKKVAGLEDFDSDQIYLGATWKF